MKGADSYLFSLLLFFFCHSRKIRLAKWGISHQKYSSTSDSLLLGKRYWFLHTFKMKHMIVKRKLSTKQKSIHYSPTLANCEIWRMCTFQIPSSIMISMITKSVKRCTVKKMNFKQGGLSSELILKLMVRWVRSPVKPHSYFLSSEETHQRSAGSHAESTLFHSLTRWFPD